MNQAVRNIKIDNILGNENPIEKWFLEILNNSVLVESDNFIRYIYQDKKIMSKVKRNSYFYYEFDRIYLVLLNNFKVNSMDISGLMKYMVETHTEWKDVTTASLFFK